MPDWYRRLNVESRSCFWVVSGILLIVILAATIPAMRNPDIDPANVRFVSGLAHIVVDNSLARVSGSEEIAGVCDSIISKVQDLDEAGVDGELTKWANDYCELHMYLKNTVLAVGRHQSDEYQFEKFIEAIARGYMGDPLGTAVEYQNQMRTDKDRINFFNEVRMKMLFKLRHLVTKYTNGRMQVSVDPSASH